MLTVVPFTFNPVQENTYILYNGLKQCCIIDPGCYFPEEKAKLQAFVVENGLKPLLLLNTHCHLDHVFGNQFVHDTWGLDLHLHPLEKQVLDFAPISGERWQLPFDNYNGPLVYLEPGKNIRLGEDELEVRFTPGHSPGSVSFYSSADGFLVSGDVLFRGSVGRTDLPGGDFNTLEQSIRTQLYPLPDATKVYSGHGPATTIGFEKANNPYVAGE